MADCNATRGITAVDYAFTAEFSVTANIEVSEPLLDLNGEPSCGETFNPTNDFEIRGKCALPDGLVAGACLSGDDQFTVFAANTKTIVKQTVEEQQGGQHHDFSASGTNYPNALVA